MTGYLASNKGASRKGLLILIALLALAIGGGYGWYSYTHQKLHEGEETQRELYTCGMHPWIIQDKPGECPICGMKLTKLEGDAAKAAKAGQAQTAKPATKAEDDFFADVGGGQKKGNGKILFYRNPMNPAITSKAPAKDEMGMDYVPVYEEEASGGDVGDRAEVRLTDDAIKRTGVQTVRVEVGELQRTARAVGRVVPDETRVKVVNTKIGGWIEKLHVNFTGQRVEAGQPLITLYSPEILATAEEYLKARAAAKRLADSPNRSIGAETGDLAALAARRLALFDVPKEEIAAMEANGVAPRAVTLRAPISGYVTGKEVFEGSRVEPGMPLFTITDLSRVWVEADLYEYEAANAKVGGEAILSLPYQPGQKLEGRVTFVSPVVDQETRTVKARFEFANAGLALKPGMFADVEMAVQSATGFIVPDSALMDTGARKLVYVEREKGTFEPRGVDVVMQSGGRAVLSSGVKAGEPVVVKANFLIDSESRLRATITKITSQAGGGGK